MRKYFLLLFLSVFFRVSYSQRNTFFSRSELGPFGGGSYYIGDLNPIKHFQDTKLALGMVYRYNLHSRAALRATFSHALLKGDDSKSNDPYMVNRNLHFNNRIVELAFGIEFNYYNYIVGDYDNPISSYLYIQLAYFNMDPTAEFNGSQVELRPLGTEGQGTPANPNNFYNRNQFAIPFGIGVKFNVIKRVAMSLDYGMRLTFTDYIDDVGGMYVDPTVLAVQNGPLAASMADRSIISARPDGTNTGLMRGNPNTRDWYSVFSVMVTIQLGNKPVCFYK